MKTSNAGNGNGAAKPSKNRRAGEKKPKPKVKASKSEKRAQELMALARRAREEGAALLKRSDVTKLEMLAEERETEACSMEAQAALTCHVALRAPSVAAAAREFTRAAQLAQAAQNEKEAAAELRLDCEWSRVHKSVNGASQRHDQTPQLNIEG